MTRRLFLQLSPEILDELDKRARQYKTKTATVAKILLVDSLRNRQEANKDDKL